MIVEKRLLHADEPVGAVRGFGRLDEKHPAFRDIHMIDLGRQGQAIFDVGRFVGG